MILTFLISLMLLQSVMPGSDSTVMPGSDRASEMADQVGHDGELNVAEIIFEHIGDEYEWHITEWKGKPIAIPLPCIVFENGLHFFTAHHAEDHGYTFNEDGKLVNALTGERPLDFSITKNVLAVMMSTLLLLVIVLSTARWYRKHDALKEAPTGLAAFMEPLIIMVHDMAKENIGADYKRFSPFLCMAFLWILLNNFLGILPFFPGGANLTGNIAITLVLALCTFFTVNLNGTKHYYKELYPGCSGLPQTHHAGDRGVQRLHETGFPYHPSVRQHAGRPYHDPVHGVHHLHRGQVRPAHDRQHDSGVGPLWRIPGCAGVPGGLYPGLRIYHAQLHLHWNGKGKRRINFKLLIL